MNTLDYVIEKYKVPEDVNVFKLRDVFKKDLHVLFKELGFKVGVEVGVYKGLNALCMLKVISGLKLYCVDCWKEVGKRKADDQKNYFSRTKRELRRYLLKNKAVLIKKYSMEAVKDFENNSLDFVYIDANHNFDFVMQDIIEWTKKVRKGGIVSGHDFYKSPIFGVVVAVKAYTTAHKIKPWFISDDERKLLKRKNWRRLRNKGKNSWFFVKEWED